MAVRCQHAIEMAWSATRLVACRAENKKCFQTVGTVEEAGFGA